MIGGTDPVQFLRDAIWAFERSSGKRPRRLVLSPDMVVRLEKLVGHVPAVTRLRFDASSALIPSHTIAIYGVPVVAEAGLPVRQGWADDQDPGCG